MGLVRFKKQMVSSCSFFFGFWVKNWRIASPRSLLYCTHDTNVSANFRLHYHEVRCSFFVGEIWFTNLPYFSCVWVLSTRQHRTHVRSPLLDIETMIRAYFKRISREDFELWSTLFHMHKLRSNTYFSYNKRLIGFWQFHSYQAHRGLTEVNALQKSHHHKEEPKANQLFSEGTFISLVHCAASLQI